MAHSTVRIAAGASVVAASLLIVGPNPAPAHADRNGSGHSSNDLRRGDAGKQASSAEDAASNFVNNVIGGIGDIAGAVKDPKTAAVPPTTAVGARGRSDIGSDIAGAGGGSAIKEVAALQSFGATEPEPAMRSAALAEAPVGDNVVAALPGGGSGSGYAGQPATAFRSPRVTFGNGRNPAAHVRRLTTAPRAVFTQDALPAPEAVPEAADLPAALEINIPPLPPPLPPIERMRPTALVGQFSTGTTELVTDPLAGVAGLILIPAIGAVLGYRQARAAQSLRESLRT